MMEVIRAIPNIKEVELETNAPPEIVYVKGGVGSVYYAGTSDARLEIGAVGTDVTGELLFPVVSGGAIIEDTFEQCVDFEDILNKALGPTIVIAGERPTPSFEAYIERIDKPGYRTEPVVKGKGIPVWAIAAYVLDLDLSYEEVVSDWEGEVSMEEVKAAMEYYRAYPEEVDKKRRWASPR